MWWSYLHVFPISTFGLATSYDVAPFSFMPPKKGPYGGSFNTPNSSKYLLWLLILYSTPYLLISVFSFACVSHHKLIHPVHPPLRRACCTVHMPYINAWKCETRVHLCLPRFKMCPMRWEMYIMYLKFYSHLIMLISKLWRQLGYVYYLLVNGYHKLIRHDGEIYFVL